MANYTNLKTTIQQAIKPNGNNEITGELLQQVLLSIVDSIGFGYQFAGVATPETDPGTGDQRVFYLASAGTYPNFGPAEVPSGSLGIFYYNDAWHVDTVEVGDDIVIADNLSTDDPEQVLSARQGNVIRNILYGLTKPELIRPTMKQGCYHINDGLYRSSSTTICTSEGIRVSGAFRVEVASGYKYNILYYDVNHQLFIRAESTVWLTDPTVNKYFDGYIHLNVAKADNSAITPSTTTGLEVTLLSHRGGLVDRVTELRTDVYGESYGERVVTSILLEQGGMRTSGTKQSGDPELTRARTMAPIRVYGDFKIALNTGYQMKVFFYRDADFLYFERSLNYWANTPYVGNYNGYIMIDVKASDDGDVTPSEVGVTLTQVAYTPGVKYKVEELAFNPSGYYYGADLLRRPLRTKFIGSLPSLIFCVYNGRYYSTNGDTIFEHDENLVQLRSASIHVESVSSLQLGHNGKAYISQGYYPKLWVIDLATLSVETMLTMPTIEDQITVIDDIQGYAYIFQANYDSPGLSAGLSVYNFIVYDYVNQQVISRRILDEPLPHIRSCDYVGGKIIVTHDIDYHGKPSGMRIYNTSGDILAVYSIDAIKTVSLVGVAFDRDNGRLLFSDDNGGVRQIYG